MRNRFVLAAAFASVTSATALQPIAEALHAQSASRGSTRNDEKKPPGDHRLRYLGMGAAIGGLLALGYYKMSDGGNRSGRCMPLNCALPYLTISGGISGLFLARERAAQRRAETPRAGESLEFPYTEVVLPAAANAFSVRDSLLVAATDSGVQVMSTVARSTGLRRRGAGLSNIRSVALNADASRLFIGSGSALWETPLTTGIISRVIDGPVDALSTHGDVVVATSGNSVRVRRGSRDAVRTDSLNAGVPITSARFDATSNRWWLTGDSLLFELTVSGDTPPVLTQRAVFGGQARSVASSTNWVVVALGSDGLAIWPRTALSGSGVTTPIVLRGEPRFAFDVAFVGDALFVAGGVDGVTQVDLSSAPRIVGSWREAGYATSVVAENGVLWVGDRIKRRVLKVRP